MPADSPQPQPTAVEAGGAQRYFVYLAYDGAAFHGWQRQPNGDSVQAQLERALAFALKAGAVQVVGAGRTDAGVNASLMVAHFDAPAPIDTGFVTARLRHILPQSVRPYCIVPVSGEAHARFSALSRTYHYYVRTADNPFRRRYSLRPLWQPDFGRMNAAAAELLRHTDFCSFSKAGTDVRTFNCRVSKAAWRQLDGGLWRFEITADRFLRNMVRAIVGTLLDISRRQGDAASLMRGVIERRDRSAAGESVAGEPLFLAGIGYPPHIFAAGSAPQVSPMEPFCVNME